jgi:hypothetical protein
MLAELNDDFPNLPLPQVNWPAVMREAVQHDWDEDLKAECGWQDDGQAMLALAIIDAPRVKRRWEWLLETDGERGQWNDKTGDWERFPPRRSRYGC